MSTTQNPAAPIHNADKSAPLVSSEANQKSIENHKKAAKHLEHSAKLHTEAAMHREAGNQSKANDSTVKAHGHQVMANEAHKEVVKAHAANTAA